MIAFAHKELRAARAMLLAATILEVARWTLWGVTTDQPVWVRATVGAIIGATVLVLVPIMLKWTNERYEALSKSTTLQKQAVQSVFLQCDYAFLPDRIPSEGKVYAIELRWNAEVSHQGGQIRQFYGDINQPIPWFDLGKPIGIYRCQVINYQPHPLFNVVFEFEATFRSAISTGISEGMTGYAGDIIGIGKVSVNIPRIDPGRHDPFTFYVYNASPYYAETNVPKTGAINFDFPASTGQPLEISRGANSTMVFSPFSTNLPTSPHPIPEPQ